MKDSMVINILKLQCHHDAVYIFHGNTISNTSFYNQHLTVWHTLLKLFQMGIPINIQKRVHMKWVYGEFILHNKSNILKLCILYI